MKSLVDRQVGTRIVKMLQDVQQRDGYVSDPEIHRIAGQVGEPVRVIQDVVSFFPHYRRSKPSRCHVAICRDMSCRLRGSAHVAQQLNALADQVGHETLELHEASCLGRCDRAPVMIVEGSEHGQSLYVDRNANEYLEIVQATLAGQPTQPDSDSKTAEATLRRSEIDCYRVEGESSGTPYSAIRKFLQDPSPERVIQSLKTAGLLGMGGAGAPAFSKWDEARHARGEAKYVVCNADESEPGTFKDRDILLASPHLVIEGMAMAALVSGAKQGYIYIRHEYQEQIDRLREAIAQAEVLGALGGNIFQSGRSFRLEVFVSPGGYVCGEQTALIEALEGKRSEPRNRPPELQTNGLYDQPTILNNVETFAWVPSILVRMPKPEVLEKEKTGNPNAETDFGGLWFKHAGKNRARGKRFFSISGDLNRPGAYEVPCGITLGELIDDYAGGMKDGMALQAVALSGPSGGFLPAILPEKAIRFPKKLDKDGNETSEFKYPQLQTAPTDIRLLPLDIDASREIGFMLGAGIVVYGATADILDQAIACSRFYQRESCGKCVPCRLGSRKMVDMAEMLATTPNTDPIVGNVVEHANLLSRIMKTTSICGLGQVASEPLRTYLRYFYSSKR
jgi:NADH:ubiquinone oxidoreductase subunit F (NADH-binding)/NADH:ubiquinone oxidoreductase subunit E